MRFNFPSPLMGNLSLTPTNNIILVEFEDALVPVLSTLAPREI